jgi:hypothetical protein
MKVIPQVPDPWTRVSGVIEFDNASKTFIRSQIVEQERDADPLQSIGRLV